MPTRTPKTKKKARTSVKAGQNARRKARGVKRKAPSHKRKKARKPFLSYFDSGFNGCW